MITHSKVSAKADGADTSLVQPSDWNADHSVTFGTGSGDIAEGNHTHLNAALVDAANVFLETQTIKTATGGRQIVWDPSDYDSDSRDWNFNVQDFANTNGTRKNTVLNFGYNVSAGGGSLDQTDHSLYMQFENYYKPDSNPGTAEWHLDFFAAGSPAAFDRRPLQFNVNTSTGYVEHFYAFDKANFTTPAGTQLGNWTDGWLTLKQNLAVGGGAYADGTIDIYDASMPSIKFRRGTTAERVNIYHDGSNLNFNVYSGGFNFLDTTGFCSFSAKTDMTFAVDSHTGIEIDPSGGVARIAFYGVTPTARQLLATGASHTVDDVITALQNLGLVKQS